MVKVKTLEWNDDRCPAAACVFGHYVIYPHYFHAELLLGYGRMSMTGLGRIQLDKGATVDDLKLAAQADYEARILSALAPQAGDNEGEPVAWMQGTFVTTNYNNVRFDEEVSGSGKYTPLYTHPSTLKDPGNVGDGGTEIIECLAAGKPFVFDPATNFLHADDGGAPEYGIKYVPVASHPCTSTPVDEEPKP